jgi:hypothetical protein
LPHKMFKYPSGEEIQAGDRILFHREPGEVQFVVTEKTGAAAKDWHIEQHPEGGVMLRVKGFGNVFLGQPETTEDLEFVARTGQVGGK